MTEDASAEPVRRRSGKLMRFSPEAVAERKRWTTGYGSDLDYVSRAIAKDAGSDNVSASDIRKAVAALGRTTSAKTRRIAEIGILLIGSALGYAGNVAVDRDFTFSNALVFTVPFATGLFLYGLAFGRD